jgi:hypothetical protein
MHSAAQNQFHNVSRCGRLEANFFENKIQLLIIQYNVDIAFYKSNNALFDQTTVYNEGVDDLA